MNWPKHKVKSNLSKHSVLSYYTILFHAENRDVVANQIREFFLQLSLIACSHPPPPPPTLSPAWFSLQLANNYSPCAAWWRFISYYTVLFYSENRAAVANQIREFCFSYDEWHTVPHFRLHDSHYFSLTIINWRLSAHLQHFRDHWPLKYSSAGPKCFLQVISQLNGRCIFSGPRNDRIIICFTNFLILWFSFSFLYLFFCRPGTD